MRVLKICASEWVGQSRDKRELSVLRELGADAFVMGKGGVGDKYRRYDIDGFDVYRVSARPLGERAPSFINRIVSIFVWAHYARKANADIISGHDIDALFIGYMSNLFRRRKNRAKLVYDSHEFELGRNIKRSKLSLLFIKHLERFLMKRCAFSIMVNDTIADEVQRIHRLKQRPVVIRSVPSYWVRDDGACESVKREFLSSMNLPDSTFLVMYHGAVLQNRGVEDIIRTASMLDGIAVCVLGHGDKEYLRSLKALADELGVGGRVLFHEAVSIDILKDYVGAADCGIVIPSNAFLSYYFSLPNKFFENIQSETPMICADYPEMANIVNKYGIGLLCNQDDMSSITACITRMMDDAELYASCKANLKEAKKELCWEKEKEILKAAYAKCMQEAL